jgi:hypothetical protein
MLPAIFLGAGHDPQLIAEKALGNQPELSGSKHLKGV